MLARSRRIRLAGLAVGMILLLAVATLSVWFGSRDIPLTGVWSLLWAEPVSYDAVTVQSYRVPRTLLGIIVGIALGLAGALMQALTRNPL
ncbi:MAG: iron chelate uptake ABC transporter family permease subunit, partial [Actinophytocola sp.]|nr:iron chelate uptake ABC transporter family permease subunit [Actinophytocola sp.]